MAVWRELTALAAAGLATAAATTQYKRRLQLRQAQGIKLSHAFRCQLTWEAARFRPAAPGSHIVVLGAGIVGVTTAYRLAERGYKVTVVEQHKQAGMATSLANAGTLNFSPNAHAWLPEKMIPVLWDTLVRSLFGSNTHDDFDPQHDGDAIQNKDKSKDGNPTPSRRNADEMMTSFQFLDISPSVLTSLDFWRWGLNFLAAAVYGAERRQRFVDTLVSASLSSLADTADKHPELGALIRRCGSMYVFFSKTQFAEACAEVDPAYDEVILTRDDAIALEPSLAHVRFAGAVQRPHDQLGDCAGFVRGLAAVCADRGVRFLYEHRAIALEQQEGAARGVALLDERTGSAYDLACDYVVVSCGADSALPLAHAAWRTLPILPVRGYSITGTVSGHHATAPDHYVLFEHPLHVLAVRFGDQLRFSSHAELTMSQIPSADKLHDLSDVVRSFFPDAYDKSKPLREWMGRRPMTADSLPLVCVGHLSNVILNTGHGADGWRWAHATAISVAALLAGEEAPLEESYLSLRRFLLL